jgi:hypothetical protein
MHSYPRSTFKQLVRTSCAPRESLNNPQNGAFSECICMHEAHSSALRR